MVGRRAQFQRGIRIEIRGWGDRRSSRRRDRCGRRRNRRGRWCWRWRLLRSGRFDRCERQRISLRLGCRLTCAVARGFAAQQVAQVGVQDFPCAFGEGADIGVEHLARVLDQRADILVQQFTQFSKHSCTPSRRCRRKCNTHSRCAPRTRTNGPRSRLTGAAVPLGGGAAAKPVPAARRRRSRTPRRACSFSPGPTGTRGRSWQRRCCVAATGPRPAQSRD